MKSDAGYIWKVQSYENYVDGLDVKMRERPGPRMTGFLA